MPAHEAWLTGPGGPSADVNRPAPRSADVLRPAPRSADVVIVGGGVIGLSAAWRTAALGLSVVLVDPAPARGASWVAAGMLAPVTEVHHGEEALLALNLESWRRWESFAEDLSRFAGCPSGYWKCGTLVAALDAGDRDWLRDLYDLQSALGLDVKWLTSSDTRAVEPGLSPGIRGGMMAAGDHQVDNRQLLGALMAANEAAGVTLVCDSALSLRCRAAGVEAVTLASGEDVSTSTVVIAAGSHSGMLAGLPPEALPAIRPVKGQIVRLLPRIGGPKLERSVRGIVEGSSVYLVPRRDGSLVVGATMEEMGYDTDITAGAVFELLRDARRLVPAISEMVLGEISAGLRPGSPDNGPVIGEVPGVAGLIVATGHFRNGILLAPVTADAVASLVTGRSIPDELAPFGPGRFSEVPC